MWYFDELLKEAFPVGDALEVYMPPPSNVSGEKVIVNTGEFSGR